MARGMESKTSGARPRDLSGPEKQRRVAAAINQPDGRKSRAEAGAKSGPRKETTAGPAKATRKKETTGTASKRAK
jgi:hypothetical protein